jgi:glycosyltransferase involved in cell wall biosynthesis
MWTKFLPYHLARIHHLRKRLLAIDWHVTAIEVASRDALYPFPEITPNQVDDYICLFSGKSYRALSPNTIHATAFAALENIQPDVVFAPATPFPSGMAAVKYGLNHKSLMIMMDDAWEGSDKRGIIVTQVKKIIHKNIDAAFIPAPSHASYYLKMGFPPDRIFYGVDVVDNDFFSTRAEAARQQADSLRVALGLPQQYFIFVGRFIERKGITTLLDAYRRYAALAPKSRWGLVLIGEGDEQQRHEEQMKDFPEVKFAGSRFSDELCQYYGLASALILPSVVETWGLVVNEAMASHLPVLVSKGSGAGHALVEEGQNGWMFGVGNAEELSQLMFRMSEMPADRLRAMGVRSKEIISNWSLDTFADSVIAAASLPQRDRSNIASYLVAQLWTGRISFYP